MRQVQQQQPVIPDVVQIGGVSSPSRMPIALMLALAGTLILTLLEAVLILLINPAHLAGLLSLISHAPLLLLIPIVEFVLLFVAVRFGSMPLAIYRYLYDVRAAQEQYKQLYTPLTALTNIRQTPDPTRQRKTGPVIEERVAILDLVQQQDTDQLILGVPGAGKTTALRVYHYSASEHPWDLVFKRKRIPIYIPMKNYSLFIKSYLPSTAENDPAEAIVADSPVNLLDFLTESDLPGITHLRPYLFQLAQQGRLLLLCDGLNEIDNNYLSMVSHELVHLMQETQNRLVMTCREVDYREQPDLVALVNKGQASRATVYPLQTDQISEFVERYVERQDNHWRHTAGQIMQVIDRSRLRYHCTNPMMLFTLMGIIDKIGVERGKQIDTRGRLLRESVKQLIIREQAQPRWNKAAPDEQEVVRFLSEVACAARWANDRNAIQLRVATSSGEDIRMDASLDELADELRFWLDEHPPEGPFAGGDEILFEPHDDVAQLLQFALSAALIDISPSGVLSFRHELIAEYFVAEYFYTVDSVMQSSPPIRLDLLENVGRWSESVAIWAGLLDQPLALAERFGELGRSNPAYVLQSLALGLVCVGVLWTPPQAEVQRPIALPQRIAESLAIAVRNRAAREELASIFTRCAEEGGQEVYRSLLPLIMVDGVDDLLILLDQSIVPELLFTQLQDTVDNIVYEAQVKRLTQVLGRFGSIVVSHAAELSQPMSERTTRLRAAAINILGGTADSRAVEPLLARISDAEPFIVSRAASALVRLGPELTLTRLLQELENRQPGPFTRRVHQAMLTILERFLSERDAARQTTIAQYQRILESVMPVLSSNYQGEPEVQQQAMALLISQAQSANALYAGSGQRSERVVESLVRLLPSQNDMAVQNAVTTLQEIGPIATPRLLEVALQAPQEEVRIRALDILTTIRDPHALSGIVQLLEETSPALQQHTVDALLAYAPESIPELISVVLTNPSELIAERAAQILITIGDSAVLPITEELLPVVPDRTRLLVYVLERLHDPRCVEALMNLLQEQHLEPLLIIAIVRALSRFPEKRVVPAVMIVLSDPRPQVYEEAITALSQLHEVALPNLVAALNVLQENATVQRVQRALLGMTPFPADAIIDMLQYSNDAQVQHILEIFRRQGVEAAQGLVRNLLHQNERVRNYVQQTLNELPGAVVVPALLEALNQPALLRVVKTLLLNYPDTAIPPLVELLGEQERADAAASILPQFGPTILKPLLSGLEDSRAMARSRAENIVVELVLQSEDEQVIMRDLVHLFAPTPPPRAREFLLEVLTNELATMSMPALLEGLEDAHLMGDAAKALVRLANNAPQHKAVLDSLLEALYFDERRRGAEEALINIGAASVPGVGELIVDPDTHVARSAKHILGKIGVPALSLVWQSINEKDTPERRNAALEIFQSMPTSVIKDELVLLLGHDKSEDIAMATALLLERMRDEAVRHYADREMVPEMLAYIQTHDTVDTELTNQRIMALLLLLGENTVLDHLLEALDDNLTHNKRLVYMLLLFGSQAYDTLLETFNDPDTTLELRADLAAILGMLSTPNEITEYAKNLSSYGLSSSRTSVLFPKQLVLAHRSLGGLLASGQWDERKIRELRDASQEGSSARELFNELLGWRYEPQLTQLQNQLQTDRETHRKEVLTLTGRIVVDQEKIRNLEDELEQMRREHGVRGDELTQTAREKDAIRANLDKTTRDNNELLQRIDRLQREIEMLQDENNQLSSQLNLSNRP